MGISVLTMNGIEMAYQNIHDKSIFDDIQLPSGIDKETLIERIFIRCGEFSVMHTNPEYFHWQTLNFFRIHYRTFEKWIEALSIVYNPLENYDRYEDYQGSGSSTNEAGSTSSDQSSGTDTRTSAAYNDSGYDPYDKLSSSEGSSGESTMEGSETHQDRHTIRTHGNIGVTTSQQMLESELDIDRFNIYQEIANLYADEFCIQVY